MNSLHKAPTLDQVCERAMGLPCSPAMLPRLISVLVATDSSAADIADIIMVDTSLASATLRLANSAYFSGGAKAETVSDAVIRLGQRELYRLAALALVSRWESGVASRGEPGDFCRHALCTALAAEALAETTERLDPQTAYTAGLVADLGKLAVAHACAPFFPAIRAICERGGTWSKAEREVLGYSHSEVGARLLRTWNFSPVMVAAAEFGEHPADGPEAAMPLLAHLHAAKYIATAFGPGVAEDGFLFEVNGTFLTEWGFTPELLQETMAIVHERAKERLRDRLTHGTVAM